MVTLVHPLEIMTTFVAFMTNVYTCVFTRVSECVGTGNKVSTPCCSFYCHLEHFVNGSGRKQWTVFCWKIRRKARSLRILSMGWNNLTSSSVEHFHDGPLRSPWTPPLLWSEQLCRSTPRLTGENPFFFGEVCLLVYGEDEASLLKLIWFFFAFCLLPWYFDFGCFLDFACRINLFGIFPSCPRCKHANTFPRKD